MIYKLNFTEAIDFCNLMISLHTLPIRVFGLEMTQTGIYNDFDIRLDLPIDGDRSRSFIEYNVDYLVDHQAHILDEFEIIKIPCRVYNGDAEFWANLKFYLYSSMENDTSIFASRKTIICVAQPMRDVFKRLRNWEK